MSRWLNALSRFGATRGMFDEARTKLSEQFGFQAPVNDALWRLMNDLVPRQTDARDLEQLYLLMGDFVQEEGQDPRPYVQQAMEVKENIIKQEVLRYKEMGFVRTRVSVNTCNDELVCEACQEISKRIYDVDVFLAEMPIPRNCKNPRGCRCWVTAKFGGQ